MAQETPRGIRLMRIAGVPVYLGYSWIFLSVAIIALLAPQLQRMHPGLSSRMSLLVAAVYALSLLGAVLIHEGAHAMAARRFNLPVLRIVADLWGGHTAYEAGKAGPGPFAVIAVVGPLANLAVGLIGLMLSRGFDPNSVGTEVLLGLTYVNLALAAFNLLPGLPLDGGQLVESAVWGMTGRRHFARVVAGWCGRLIVIAILMWIVLRPLLLGQQINVFTALWMFFIGIFLWRGASAAIETGSVLGGLEALSIQDLVRSTVPVSMTAPISATDPERGVVIVLDDDASPIGLLDSDAVHSLHPLARDNTPVSAVTLVQPSDWVVDLDSENAVTSLVSQMQQRELGVAAVRVAGVPRGIVTADDLIAALRARGVRVATS